MRAKLEAILESANISINGDNPWDMQIHQPECYKRVITQPSLGLGESYMDGWWDCDALDSFFYHLLSKLQLTQIYTTGTLLKAYLKNTFWNHQSKPRSKQVAHVHYNLGNDLYQPMLGPTMAYTCGYWKDVDTLDAAQNQKYDLVCRKLNLQPGERVLELGCGWGGFAAYAAKNFGVEMHSVNISTEQMAYAADLCRDLPVYLYTTDYRNIDIYNPQGKRFDKLVSIGMCEHVGCKNYATFLKIARQQLNDDGLFLLHTIGKTESLHFADPWIQKYIFPNGMLPTVQALSMASEPYFVIEDVHNFGADYDKTLMAWYQNFKHSWSQLTSQYDERFYRMWCYYLLSCAGAFRARKTHLFQFVLSPNGVVGGYDSIR